MAWFESGRAGTVTYEFTVHAHHAAGPYYPPHPVCKSGGRVGGPNFEAEMIAHNVQWPNGTVSRFVVSVRVFNFVSGAYAKTWSFYSTPTGYPPPGTFDATASATIRISFPVRERKEVRLGTPPGGPYDWLPPDVELVYALHPDPDGDIEVEVSSSDTHFNGTGSYPAANFAEDNNHAPYMALTLASDTSVGGPRHFTGMVAAVSGASCSLAGLNFKDGGSPGSGFDISTQRAHCWTSADGLRLDLTEPQGISEFSCACAVYPVFQWAYDGHVKAFDQAYPGDPEIYDAARDAVYTAPGGHLEESFSARRFTWSYSLEGQTDSEAVNDQPSFLKLHLDEEWCETAGEDPEDRRIPLEDDVEWDALQLTRDTELQLEPLDSASGWTWVAGDGTLGTAFGRLSAAPTEEDSEIGKTVDHNLGTYRYLKVDLRADYEQVPVRIVLGSFFWDVLVEEADTWETKTLDLAAPHNATSFDDVEALQAITALGFAGLQPEITYGFRDLRLEVASTDHLRVLPPFRKEQILFHESDRRPGLTANFRDQSLAQMAAAVNDRTDSGFGATAVTSTHAYYNPDAPSGFIQDRMETLLGAGLTLKARVRADRIIPWVGMGDPSGSMGSGTLTVRFTKRLRGLLAGLVFIRDVPGTSLTTRVEIREGETLRETLTTDGTTRAYRASSPYLKAGEYVLRRIDQDDVAWMTAERSVANRETAYQHLRAQVIDFDSREAIPEAEVDAEITEYIEYGDIDYSRVDVFYASTTAGGMYAVANLTDAPHDAFANTTDRSEDRYLELGMPEKLLYDVAFALMRGGGMSGTVKDYENSDPVQTPDLSVDQSESAWADCETVTGDGGGAFSFESLNCRSERAVDNSDYDAWVLASGYSPKRIESVRVEAGDDTSLGDVLIHPYGAIQGNVTETGLPVADAMVFAAQDDGERIGWGVAETDANGDYTINDLGAGPQSTPASYTVTVVTATQGSLSTDVSSNDISTLDFSL